MVVPLTAAALLAIAPVAAQGPALPLIEGRVPVLETPYFVFYSHFDFNLYDALLTSATQELNVRSDPLGGECFDELALEERAAWKAAVGYYAAAIASTSDFSRERFLLRQHLTRLPFEPDKEGRRDQRLGQLLLEAAAPAYRSCRWPDRDRVNRRWIEALAPRLEAHSEFIAERLTTAFRDSWRELPIPVDVVETAGWAGADTVGSPWTHIQISSTDPAYEGDAALEMVFHEASHELVGPRNGPIARELAAAAEELALPVPPRGLWHALLFVTAGEVTRSRLGATGTEGYVPVATAVVGRAWRRYQAPLEEHWLPLVRGESSDHAAAMLGLLRSIAEAEEP